MFFNDKMLYNQNNPYLVHYENFEGSDYPIITILKGTLLFTGREVKSSSLSESYFHLYKFREDDLIDYQTLPDDIDIDKNKKEIEYNNTKVCNFGMHKEFTYFLSISIYVKYCK